MTRRHFTVPCKGETLAMTLDEAPGKIGLLIVSGGNETRNGAFAGQSRLAARIAANGYPVLRFDRRGVGDSSGRNAGFRSSADELREAFKTLRRECASVRKIVAFGNCDAASALMLGRGYSAKALVLANPWTFDSDTDQQTVPEAIKARYWQKLHNPHEIMRLLTGKVSLGGVMHSMRRALFGKSNTTALGEEMARGLASYSGEYRILLAGRDRTAQAFKTNYPMGEEPIVACPTADHAFSAPEDSAWLEEQILAVIESQA